MFILTLLKDGPETLNYQTRLYAIFQIQLAITSVWKVQICDLFHMHGNGQFTYILIQAGLIGELTGQILL